MSETATRRHYVFSPLCCANPACDAVFLPTGSGQRWCPPCKAEKIRARTRRRKAERLAAIPTPACLLCGAPCVGRRRSTRKFCKTLHNNVWLRLTPGQRERVKSGQVDWRPDCAQCGASMTGAVSPYGVQTRFYCDDTCKRRAWRFKIRKTPPNETCAVCGVELDHALLRADAKTCGKRCRLRRKRQMSREKLIASRPERGCDWCGAPLPKGCRADTRFCSDQCWRERADVLRREKIVARGGKLRAAVGARKVYGNLGEAEFILDLWDFVVLARRGNAPTIGLWRRVREHPTPSAAARHLWRMAPFVRRMDASFRPQGHHHRTSDDDVVLFNSEKLLAALRPLAQQAEERLAASREGEAA